MCFEIVLYKYSINMLYFMSLKAHRKKFKAESDLGKIKESNCGEIKESDQIKNNFNNQA